MAVNYRSGGGEAEEVVRTIVEAGGSALGVQADVARADDIRRMVSQKVEQFAEIGMLVNNAGIEHETPFLEKSEEEWDRVVAVDLKGPSLCSEAAGREKVRAGTGGTIINISSVHEDLAFPGYAAYCAAKGGLRMLCRTLALELTPLRINVVNAGPGAIATPINRHTLEDPERRAKLERSIPLARIGTPEDVARLVAYLASDDASCISGTTVSIDGGLMRQAGSLYHRPVSIPVADPLLLMAIILAYLVAWALDSPYWGRPTISGVCTLSGCAPDCSGCVSSPARHYLIRVSAHSSDDAFEAGPGPAPGSLSGWPGLPRVQI